MSIEAALVARDLPDSELRAGQTQVGEDIIGQRLNLWPSAEIHFMYLTENLQKANSYHGDHAIHSVWNVDGRLTA